MFGLIEIHFEILIFFSFLVIMQNINTKLCMHVKNHHWVKTQLKEPPK
jgi:hypothetical protein